VKVQVRTKVVLGGVNKSESKQTVSKLKLFYLSGANQLKSLTFAKHESRERERVLKSCVTGIDHSLHFVLSP